MREGKGSVMGSCLCLCPSEKRQCLHVVGMDAPVFKGAPVTGQIGVLFLCLEEEYALDLLPVSMWPGLLSCYSGIFLGTRAPMDKAQ